MYAKILVAVDGSDASLHALQQAIALAKALPAALRIVHVVDMSWLPIGPEIAIDTAVMSAARRGVGENIVSSAGEAYVATAFEWMAQGLDPR